MAYLSGKRGLGGPGCYSQDDVDALRALAEEPGIVDLFLTYPMFHCIVLFNIYECLYRYILGSLDEN